MTQIDGAGQQDTDDQNAEALQAALAQRQVTLQGQPQGGSDVPSHQNSDPVRRIGNSTLPLGSYRKTSCTMPGMIIWAARLSLRAIFGSPGPQPTAVLRPAKRPKGTEIRALLRRL